MANNNSPMLPAQILLDEGTIKSRVSELAGEISNYYGAERIVVVGVLKGAHIFMADLVRELDVEHSIEFIGLRSYKRSSRERMDRPLELTGFVQGEHVLLIDGVVDSGTTMKFAIKLIKSRNATSIRTCTLIRKVVPGHIDVDHVGFDFPSDVWAVGYGMDYAERYRSLKYIAELDLAINRGAE